MDGVGGRRECVRRDGVCCEGRREGSVGNYVAIAKYANNFFVIS